MNQTVTSKTAQRGFTITELMLVMGVGASMLAGAFLAYKSVSETQTDQETIAAHVNLLLAVREKWAPLGSYATVGHLNIYNAGLVAKPLSWDGANIKSSWASETIHFNGDASHLVGWFYGVPGKKCIEIVGALDPVASFIEILSTSGTYWLKYDGGALDSAQVVTQCGHAGNVPRIRAWVS